MAARTRYLLLYDIRSPSRLRRVHQVATDHGDPLQYSAFICDLTAVELSRLRMELRDEMNLTEDSVAIFDLGSPATRGVQRVEFLGYRPRLPGDGGAEVW